jgi:hypothetical protein
LEYGIEEVVGWREWGRRNETEKKHHEIDGQKQRFWFLFCKRKLYLLVSYLLFLLWLTPLILCRCSMWLLGDFTLLYLLDITLSLYIFYTLLVFRSSG